MKKKHKTDELDFNKDKMFVLQKTRLKSRIWQHTFIIPTLKRLDWKFKDSLGKIMSSGAT